MADQDAWAMLDQIAGPEGQPTSPDPSTTAPDSPSADDPWSMLDQIAGPDSAGDSAKDQPRTWTPDDIDAHLGPMLADPKVSGKQIREWLTSIGSQLNENDQTTLDNRDAYIAAHPGDAGNVRSRATPAPYGAEAGQVVDNRPVSFWSGFRDGVDHVGENITGGAGWIANRVGLENDWGDDYRANNAQIRAERDYRGSRYGKIVGEIGATLPAVALSAPVEGVAGAAGASMAAARAAGLIADGAAGGALTTTGRTPVEVLRDTAIGAGASLAFGGVADVLGRRIARPSQTAIEGRQVLDAADRLSRDGMRVRPAPADVGGPTTRRLTGGVNQSIIGGSVLRNRAAEGVETLTQVRNRAANELAPAGETARPLVETADDLLDTGSLGGYRDRSRAEATRQYEAAERLAGTATVRTPNLVRALGEKVRQLRAVPGGSSNLTALERLQDDLTSQDWTVSGLRRLRTELGRQLDATNPDSRELASALRAPLARDIDDGLRIKGQGEAADRWQTADAFYAQRATNLKDIERVIGTRNNPKSAEAVAGRLMGLSRTDGELIGRVLSTLEPDQAAHVRASMVLNLGRAKPGVQNAAGSVFSPETFLTNWQSSNLSDSAKAALVNNPSVLADLNALATISQGAREAGKYRNTSNTAGALNVLNWIKGIASGAAGWSSVGGSMIGEAASGFALSSPNLARTAVAIAETKPLSRAARSGAEIARRATPAVSGYLMNLPRPQE